MTNKSNVCVCLSNVCTCLSLALQTDDSIRLLRQAMDWQTEVMLETILGYGVDNHLLGLQQIALSQGKAIPAFFADPTYHKANCFRLGTSQVSPLSHSFTSWGGCVLSH